MILTAGRACSSRATAWSATASASALLINGLKALSAAQSGYVEAINRTVAAERDLSRATAARTRAQEQSGRRNLSSLGSEYEAISPTSWH